MLESILGSPCFGKLPYVHNLRHVLGQPSLTRYMPYESKVEIMGP